MRIDILTIIPEIFRSIKKEGIMKIALEKGLLELEVHNIRYYTKDRARQVDDYPYGGGPGMILKPEPIFEAAYAVIKKNCRANGDKPKIILLSPRGKKLEQKILKDLVMEKWIMLICGHYEGIDERVCQYLIDDEISIGDYILSGGEIPAMVLTDAIIRLIPGVLGNEASIESESFTDNLLEYPQYTRPPEYLGMFIPEILTSGHHAEVARWRRKKAIEKTSHARPDLLKKTQLNK